MKKESKVSLAKALDMKVLKKELTGIMLMLGSLFLISAILCFNPEDEASYAALAWYDIFSNAARDAAESIHNPFGLFGARLAAFFIRAVLGYPVIFPITSFFLGGISLIRSRSLKPALLYFLYSLLISIDVAAMFGLTSASFSDVMAGAIGRMLAALLSTVIGFSGAWILLGVIAVVLTFYMGRGTGASVMRSTMVVQKSFGKLFADFRAKREENQKKKAEQRALKEKKKMKVEAKERVPKPHSLKFDQQASSVSPLEDQFLPSDVAAPELSSAKFTGLAQMPNVPGEPEMIIHTGIREKEADLDERKLKVQTKDREAYRFPSIDLL